MLLWKPREVLCQELLYKTCLRTAEEEGDQVFSKLEIRQRAGREGTSVIEYFPLSIAMTLLTGTQEKEMESKLLPESGSQPTERDTLPFCL